MTTALRHAEPLVHAAPRIVRRRSGFLLSAAVLTVCLTLLVAAFIQSQMVTGQHRIDELERQRIEEQAHLQNDRVALAREQSPDNIMRKAEALGMIVPENRVVVSTDSTAEPVVDEVGR